MHRYDFRLLGPLEADRDGEPVDLPGGKVRALLAVLAVREGRVVAIDEIVGRLWNESAPAGARTTVRGYVLRLRGALGDRTGSVVRSTPNGYRLAVDTDDLDLSRFQALLAKASAVADVVEESRLLVEAGALWRGDALADVPSEALHRDVVPGLREQRLRALRRRIELDLAHGDPAAVIAELRDLVTANPMMEAFWEQLLRALCLAGRPAEALASYEDCRAALVENLGVGPGAGLRRLHGRILRDDPDLLPIAPRPRGGESVTCTPQHLPPDIAHFVGREAQIAALDRVAADRVGDGTVVVIDGPAGVGKTALAVHWARRAGSLFPDGRLYLDLKGFSARRIVEPHAALGMLLRALGRSGGGVPDDLEERAAMLRGVLAGRRVLVVLDNVRHTDHVRDLLTGTAALVVITSRRQLRGLAVQVGARRITVDRLAPDESRRLLARLLDESDVADDESAAELADLCSHSPLALCIATERRQRRPSLSLADFVAELRLEETLMDVFAVGDESTDLPSVLSWSYSALLPSAARLFRVLGTRTRAEFDVETAARLGGLSARSAGKVLDALADLHLVEQHGYRTYRMDDLVRAFAEHLRPSGAGLQDVDSA